MTLRLRLVLLAALLFALPAHADWAYTFMPQATGNTNAPVYVYDFTTATDSTGADLSKCTGGVDARFDQSLLDGSTDAVAVLMACPASDSVWQACSALKRGPSSLPDGQLVSIGTVPADKPFLLVHVETAPSSDTARMALTCRTDAYKVTSTGLRAGLPAVVSTRMDYAYPPLFLDFNRKDEIAPFTTNGGTTGTPTFATIWVSTNIGSPTGAGVSNLFGGIFAENPGSVASTGYCYRIVGDWSNFSDGNASDPSLNSTIFESRVALLNSSADADFTSAVGINTATATAGLSTAGALAGTSSDAAVFLITTDIANQKATVKFQTRRAGTNGTISAALTTPWSTAGSLLSGTVSEYVRLGFRCYGDFTNNSGHCLVYVNGTQVLDYTDTMPSATSTGNPFPSLCTVNGASGTAGASQAAYVDYFLSASTKTR